jgi:hypothetical protein
MTARIGKIPPDLRYWLVPGEAPAFVRFEGRTAARSRGGA